MVIRHFWAALVALLLAGTAQAGELVVVVSANNPAPRLDSAQVAQIFLAQTVRLPNGAPVTAIDQPIGAALRDTFYSKLTGMSPTLVKAYWSKMAFTGRGMPPRVAPGSVAIRKLVAENTLLIGYLDSDDLDASVRVVFVVNAMPGQR